MGRQFVNARRCGDLFNGCTVDRIYQPWNKNLWAETKAE